MDHLKEDKDIEVKEWVLRDIMKNELDLRYKRIKQISWQGNSEKNKILRQHFAQSFLQLDFSRKVVCNIDETWLGMSDFRRMHWKLSKVLNMEGFEPFNKSSSVGVRQMGQRVSMIVGVDKKGNVYLCLSQSNSNKSMMGLFM